jgi:hypothetical protein
MRYIRAGFAAPPLRGGEGRGEPGQMGISAFGTSSTFGEGARLHEKLESLPRGIARVPI